MKINSKEAVSPVIGVILMVAITVILAAIVYLWVVTLIPSVKEAPAISGTTSAFGKGFTVNIMSMQGGGGATSISVKALTYVLRGADGTWKDGGAVEDIYGTYSANGVKFQDNTYIAGTSPGALSGTDLFYLKNPVNGGVATPGCKLELIYTPTGSVCGTFTLA